MSKKILIITILFILIIILGFGLFNYNESAQTYISRNYLQFRDVVDKKNEGNTSLIKINTNYNILQKNQRLTSATVYVLSDYQENNGYKFVTISIYNLKWNNFPYKWEIVSSRFGYIQYMIDSNPSNIIEYYLKNKDKFIDFVYTTESEKSVEGIEYKEQTIQSYMQTFTLNREEAEQKYEIDYYTGSTSQNPQQTDQQIQDIQKSYELSDQLDQRTFRQSAIEIVAKFENLSDEEAAKKIDQTINSDGNITADELQELADSYSR